MSKRGAWRARCLEKKALPVLNGSLDFGESELSLVRRSAPGARWRLHSSIASRSRRRRRRRGTRPVEVCRATRLASLIDLRRFRWRVDTIVVGSRRATLSLRRRSLCWELVDACRVRVIYCRVERAERPDVNRWLDWHRSLRLLTDHRRDSGRCRRRRRYRRSGRWSRSGRGNTRSRGWNFRVRGRRLD